VQGDFGKCVKAVVEGKPGLNFLAVGEMLSWDSYLETWCNSQGVQSGGYEEHTIESFMNLLPGGLGREFGENVLFGQQFGYDGSDPAVVRPSDVSNLAQQIIAALYKPTQISHANKQIVWYSDDLIPGILSADGLFFNSMRWHRFGRE
jgi:hypothetical protein